jgi:hypothetical protein
MLQGMIMVLPELVSSSNNIAMLRFDSEKPA